MHCPYCLHKETKVLDKRDNEGTTKRRRECLKCEKRFNTFENVERVDLRVIKKDGSREGYDREKVKSGILKACEKRPVTAEQIEQMMTNAEESLRKKGKEVESRFIGDVVSNELKKVDKVAYIRFASVYKQFDDIADFKKEIMGLKK